MVWIDGGPNKPEDRKLGRLLPPADEWVTVVEKFTKHPDGKITVSRWIETQSGEGIFLDKDVECPITFLEMEGRRLWDVKPSV
jgi:hypothetical protein